MRSTIEQDRAASKNRLISYIFDLRWRSARSNRFAQIVENCATQQGWSVTEISTDLGAHEGPGFEEPLRCFF